MSVTVGRINRTGKVYFSDSRFDVVEEDLSDSFTRDERSALERQFRHDVFKRVGAVLLRMGWSVESHGSDPHHYYFKKRELRGYLTIFSRTIEFVFVLAENCATRSDAESRYNWSQEACMPESARFLMQMTRLKVRDHLLNTFTGYEFVPDQSGRKADATAIEIIEQSYRESARFKGDVTHYQISDLAKRAADGGVIENGARVWFFDRKGRIWAGTAYYDDKDRWWVVTGAHGLTKEPASNICVHRPDNLRIKRNARQRRERLQTELAAASSKMEFERAAMLRDLLCPKRPQLFVVWHKEHKAYHSADFIGYTVDRIAAGRFTAEEVRAWRREPNEVITVAGMARAQQRQEG